MARTVAALNRDMLSRLPVQARECVYWELDPVRRSGTLSAEQRVAAKESWVSEVLLEWGCCGRVATVDGALAGFVLYAPPALVPSAGSLATSPVSADALLLTTGQVLPEFRGIGIGRLLVQAVVKDAVRRRVRAVEAFAARRGVDRHDDLSAPCMLPVGFLSSVGFRTARAHPSTPRMRLEVRSTVTWREDMGNAVDRLFGTLRPAPSALGA